MMLDGQCAFRQTRDESFAFFLGQWSGTTLGWRAEDSRSCSVHAGLLIGKRKSESEFYREMKIKELYSKLTVIRRTHPNSGMR